MSSRVLLVLLFFLVIVGGGTAWLVFNIRKRKKLLESLLSLPKERRFFWYKLRKAGFRIVSRDSSRNFSVRVDGNRSVFALKADFLSVKNGRKYVCLFHHGGDERETLKQYFIYASVFRADGVVFYFENTRNFSIFE